MKQIRKIIDSYLVYALPIDITIVGVICLSSKYFPLFEVFPNDFGTNLDLLGNLIGASISLAGFVLASLTIIVSIRANTKTKLPENAQTPLELFFSVGTYKTILKVFKIAIIELVFCFIYGAVIWLLANNVSNDFIFQSLVNIIFLISFSTIRSLFVMFLLITKD